MSIGMMSMGVEIGLSNGGEFSVFFFDPGPEAFNLCKGKYEDGEEFLIPPFKGDIGADFKLTDIKLFDEIEILFLKSLKLVIEYNDFILRKFLFLDFQCIVIVGMLKV